MNYKEAADKLDEFITWSMRQRGIVAYTAGQIAKFQKGFDNTGFKPSEILMNLPITVRYKDITSKLDLPEDNKQEDIIPRKSLYLMHVKLT